MLVLLEVLPACPAAGWVTSEYGPRRHPVLRTRRFHHGVDVANVRGTPVHAPWRAEVVRVARSRTAGLHVVLRTGGITTTLAHLSRALVAEGDEVSRGALVGLMGRSGRATGPHLHVALKRGRRSADPAFLLARCPVLP